MSSPEAEESRACWDQRLNREERRTARVSRRCYPKAGYHRRTPARYPAGLPISPLIRAPRTLRMPAIRLTDSALASNAKELHPSECMSRLMLQDLLSERLKLTVHRE